MPGAHRKIRQTKQRRIAGALGGTAVVALLAAGLRSCPASPRPPRPRPSRRPTTPRTASPSTAIGRRRTGWTKAWVGKPGENTLDFTWTPTTNNLVLRTFCRSTSSTPKSILVWFDGQWVSSSECSSGTGSSPEALQPVPPDSPLWADLKVGRPVRVRVVIVDDASRREGDSSAQLALGIYNSPVLSVDQNNIPTRNAPTSPDDVTKDGIRFRAKVGGDTLAAAAVGDKSQNSIELTFTPNGAPLVLRSFCTATNKPHDGAQYEVSVRIGKLPARRMSCFANSTDAGADGLGSTVPLAASPEPVQVTATIVDLKGNPVTVKDARLALGVYFQGAQRVVTAPDGSKVSLNEVTEANGYTYKLAELKTADAATARKLSIGTPAGKPFVFAAGSTALGGAGRVTGKVTGIDTGFYLATDPSLPGGPDDFGLSLTAEPPGAAGTATFELEQGHPTKGKYVLAVYLPME